MPKIGKIDVSIQELRSISKECQGCMEDLKGELEKCNKIMEGLFEDGWESDSGDKLAKEYENLSNRHFQNYLNSLAGYAQFCENVIYLYEQGDITDGTDVSGIGIMP